MDGVEEEHLPARPGQADEDTEEHGAGVGGQRPTAAPQRVKRGRNHGDRPHDVDERFRESVIRGQARERAPDTPEERRDEGIDQPCAAIHRRDLRIGGCLPREALGSNRLTFPLKSKETEGPTLSLPIISKTFVFVNVAANPPGHESTWPVSQAIERLWGWICGQGDALCTFTHGARSKEPCTTPIPAVKRTPTWARRRMRWRKDCSWRSGGGGFATCCRSADASR